MATTEYDEDPIQTLLDRIRKAADGDRVAVRRVFEKTGEDSFATALVVVSLVMVTPLSGIPTAPTLGAILIFTISLQWMVGRTHLWLPEWIMRREVKSERVHDALEWLEKPARFIDRNTRCRLSALTHRPLGGIALLVILAVVTTWPFLEVLPFFTTVCAVGVSLLAFGLMTKDGLWLVLGYLFIATLVGIAIFVI